MGSDARRNPLSFESARRRPVLLDRLSREVHVGDLVTMATRNLEPALFTVKEIVPNLLPNAPANTIRVTFELLIGSLTVAEQPNADLVLVALKPSSQETPDAPETGDSHRDN
jgi:hypothetical protein